MKSNYILLKSNSFLLLMGIVHMNVCSALCETGLRGCCEKKTLTTTANKPIANPQKQVYLCHQLKRK